MAIAHDSPPVPLPLDQYAHAFDDLFHTYIQRRRFRDYLAGLLLPRDRNKTLTALVGAEPITQAQTAPVQQLQFFLTEADWDAEVLTSRRIALLQADPLTAPHADGALVIDETGVRKDGTHTAHVGYQYLGTIGKTANGIVAVTSLWADERVYYPLQVRPYTPAARLAGGKHHPAFRTKPQLALELVQASIPNSSGRCGEPMCPMCSRSSRRRSSGRRRPSRSHRGRRPTACAGAKAMMPSIQGPGRRSCAASTMAMKRRGGRWICGWAATPPSIRLGWW